MTKCPLWWVFLYVLALFELLGLKGVRMTTEEKNKILELYRNEHKGVREISRQLNISLSSVHSIIDKNEIVVKYASCPNCGKEIAIRHVKGRRPIYCSKKCKEDDYKRTHKRRHVLSVCKCCGRQFRQYTFSRFSFCSCSCANKYRNGNK